MSKSWRQSGKNQENLEKIKKNPRKLGIYHKKFGETRKTRKTWETLG